MTSMPATTGIMAQEVCKSFGDHLVLDKVSLAVEEGTILALLGPNGVGKASLLDADQISDPAQAGAS